MSAVQLCVRTLPRCLVELGVTINRTAQQIGERYRELVRSRHFLWPVEIQAPLNSDQGLAVEVATLAKELHSRLMDYCPATIQAFLAASAQLRRTGSAL